MAKKTFGIKLTANVKGWMKAMLAATTSTKKLNKSIKVGGKGFGDNANKMGKYSAKMKKNFQTLQKSQKGAKTGFDNLGQSSIGYNKRVSASIKSVFQLGKELFSLGKKTKSTSKAVKDTKKSTEGLDKAAKKTAKAGKQMEFAFNGVDKAVKETGKSVTQATKKMGLLRKSISGASGALGMLKKVGKKAFIPFAIGAGLIGTAIMALKTLIKMSTRATEIEVQSKAFANLMSTHAVVAKDVLAKLKKVSKGTLDVYSIMQTASRAVLLGIPAYKLTELMEVARNASKAMGTEVSAAFSDIALGIGRQSRLILDNLGIIVRVGVAYDKYANKIGVAADALTDYEKKLAFTEETLRMGKGIEDRGDDIEDFQDKIAQLNVMIKEFGYRMSFYVKAVVASLHRVFEKLGYIKDLKTLLEIKIPAIMTTGLTEATDAIVRFVATIKALYNSVKEFLKLDFWSQVMIVSDKVKNMFMWIGEIIGKGFMKAVKGAFWLFGGGGKKEGVEGVKEELPKLWKKELNKLGYKAGTKTKATMKEWRGQKGFTDTRTLTELQSTIQKNSKNIKEWQKLISSNSKEHSKVQKGAWNRSIKLANEENAQAQESMKVLNSLIAAIEKQKADIKSDSPDAKKKKIELDRIKTSLKGSILYDGSNFLERVGETVEKAAHIYQTGMDIEIPNIEKAMTADHPIKMMDLFEKKLKTVTETMDTASMTYQNQLAGIQPQVKAMVNAYETLAFNQRNAAQLSEKLLEGENKSGWYKDVMSLQGEGAAERMVQRLKETIKTMEEFTGDKQKQYERELKETQRRMETVREGAFIETLGVMPSKKFKQETNKWLMQFGRLKKAMKNHTKELGLTTEQQIIANDELLDKLREHYWSLTEEQQRFFNQFQKETNAMHQETDKLSRGMIKWADDFDNARGRIEAMGVQLAQSLADSLGNFFFKAIKGELTSLQETFQSFFDSILKEITSFAGKTIVSKAIRIFAPKLLPKEGASVEDLKAIALKKSDEDKEIANKQYGVLKSISDTVKEAKEEDKKIVDNTTHKEGGVPVTIQGEQAKTIPELEKLKKEDYLTGIKEHGPLESQHARQAYLYGSNAGELINKDVAKDGKISYKKITENQTDEIVAAAEKQPKAISKENMLVFQSLLNKEKEEEEETDKEYKSGECSCADKLCECIKDAIGSKDGLKPKLAEGEDKKKEKEVKVKETEGLFTRIKSGVSSILTNIGSAVSTTVREIGKGLLWVFNKITFGLLKKKTQDKSKYDGYSSLSEMYANREFDKEKESLDLGERKTRPIEDISKSLEGMEKDAVKSSKRNKENEQKGILDNLKSNGCDCAEKICACIKESIGDGPGFLSKLGGGIRRVVGGIGIAIGGILTGIGSAFSKVYGMIKGEKGGTVKSVVEKAPKGPNLFSKVVGFVFDSVKKLASSSKKQGTGTEGSGGANQADTGAHDEFFNQGQDVEYAAKGGIMDLVKFARGGISSLDFEADLVKFAKGGVANMAKLNSSNVITKRPTLAAISEKGQREAIVPLDKFADLIKPTTFVINALDAQSFQEYVKANKDTIASAVLDVKGSPTIGNLGGDMNRRPL